MPNPLLNSKKKKAKVLTTEDAVHFLKKHFDTSGYGGRRKFCEVHKLSYSTLNRIINYDPTSKKQSPLPLNKITEIFKALGYKCQIIRTIEFHIEEA